MSPRSSSHTVALVCDFFYPNMGGVEMHLWYLSQCLLARGHKVVVVTHAYGDRQGVRYMTNNLKVYYLPLGVAYDQVILPTLWAFFPLFRNILVREGVTLVHGHQSTSTLSGECIFYARAMGYPVVYTDHSLFSVSLEDGIASVVINKILEITLADVDHIIAVSKACKFNLLERAKVDGCRVPVTVIPNAVDGSKFTPDPSKRYPRDTINIVVLSRLVHRKGINLLTQIIPIVCDKFPQVHFIVGGDGPLRAMLERMCEKHTRSDLHHRVELLGTVAHCDVRDVLVRGHLFLNCSFTESFCMALLEAASCGLFVVSTDVGGIPEVLPPSMISLAKPNAEDVLRALEEAILIQATEQKASSFSSSSAGEKELQVIRQRHSTVCAMYSWPEVAKSAERVYDQVQANRRDDTLLARLRRYAIVLGPIWGLLACLLAVCMHLLWCLCDFVWPANKIERCIQFKEEEEDGEEEEEDQKSR